MNRRAIPPLFVGAIALALEGITMVECFRALRSAANPSEHGFCSAGAPCVYMITGPLGGALILVFLFWMKAVAPEGVFARPRGEGPDRS